MPAERQDHAAPEGAHCAVHPERGAAFTCPRCGNYACPSCWHPSVERCGPCLSRDPTEAAAPVPWERGDRPALLRFFATLASALRPIHTAPAFARDDVAAALRFLWLSALPLALLTGVIPYTRTLLFKGAFEVVLVGHPSGLGIALDVARAALAELALNAVRLGCLLLPFASLVRAYSHPQRMNAALRVMFYRFWLLPATLLLFYLAIGALPAPRNAAALPPVWAVVQVARQLGAVLLMLAMGATARLACGLGLVMSVVVVIVPFLLLGLVDPLATRGLEYWLLAMTGG
jgi:hypothetical protein